MQGLQHFLEGLNNEELDDLIRELTYILLQEDLEGETEIFEKFIFELYRHETNYEVDVNGISRKEASELWQRFIIAAWLTDFQRAGKIKIRSGVLSLKNQGNCVFEVL
jgi:predicted Ser/Thr protein kinase